MVTSLATCSTETQDRQAASVHAEHWSPRRAKSQGLQSGARKSLQGPQKPDAANVTVYSVERAILLRFAVTHGPILPCFAESSVSDFTLLPIQDRVVESDLR